MTTLHTHWHDKTVLPELSCMEDNPAGIKANYIIDNEKEFKKVKNLVTPVNPFILSNQKGKENSLNKIALELLIFKAVEFTHKLIYEWFDAIKKTRKELIIHLFQTSPFEALNTYCFTFPVQDPIHIFLSTKLIRALIKESEQRIYIPENWYLHPKEDLLLSLDFKIAPWRNMPKLTETHSTMFVWHIVKFRIAGLSRLTHLEKGVFVEGNHHLARFELESHFKELLDSLNHYRGIVSFKITIHLNNHLQTALDPQMMLHAIGVYIQKNKLIKAEKIWKEVAAGKSFSGDTWSKKFSKLYSIGRKIDVEAWYQYLMEPAFELPPILSKKLIREIHYELVRKAGKPSFWKKYDHLIRLQAENAFKLKKSRKRQMNLLEGIQFNASFPIEDRINILVEQHS
jgi:hypothetical protein